jgi:hypothetical protein
MSDTIIHRKEHRETLTFEALPSPETRERLRDAGYRYGGNGAWFRNSADSRCVGAMISAIFPALALWMAFRA